MTIISLAFTIPKINEGQLLTQTVLPEYLFEDTDFPIKIVIGVHDKGDCLTCSARLGRETPLSFVFRAAIKNY